MKSTLWVVGLSAALIIAWSFGRVQGQQAAGSKKVIFVSSGEAKYIDAPTGGSSMAALWGDSEKGAHATFTKFVPGFDAGMHHHTNDIWIVGIKGAYVYKDEAGEKRVGPGDFLFVPGGKKHTSGGDKTDGALFYEESSGKFDLVPEK